MLFYSKKSSLDFQLTQKYVRKIKCVHLEILKVFGHLSKMASSRNNNGNADILVFISNVKLSSAKIRVPDPLLVLNGYALVFLTDVVKLPHISDVIVSNYLDIVLLLH